MVFSNKIEEIFLKIKQNNEAFFGKDSSTPREQL